jgi:GAF domain-containing protein/HAMP domain-containing protein
MFNLMNLKFGTKILLLGIGSVLVTILAIVAAVIWQSGQFSALAQDQFAQVAENDLSHIAEGVYNMVKAQDEAVQQQVNSSLHVAELVIHNAGQVKLADEQVNWTAFNESSQRPINVQLPRMYVGDTWLGQNTRQYSTTPIVDHVQLLVGGTATIFQRMNEQGDMLRVATNVLLANGERAIGTYIPAVGADGSPDPVVAAILRGSVYRGSTFVVNAWYDAAFEPIRDESGQVVGMLYVGIKQESVESIREAILRTRVGQSGYVYVLGGTGADQGRYIISQRGFRDGENVWWAQDAAGNLTIQFIVNKALTLKLGDTARERYQWQDIGDPTPRWKIARITYYEPWHWVIAASIDESEIQASRLILENGQTRMIAAAGTIGLAIALIAGFLSVLLARSIARPVTRLANVATQVTAGHLDVTATVESKDEIGTLATTFNSMTAQLRDLIDSLETRVKARTEQLQASADVGRAAASILDTDELLRTIVNLITDHFGFYYAAVFLRDEAGQWAVLREATGEAGHTLKESGHRLEIGGQSMVSTAMTSRRPSIALDVGDEAVRFANPLLPDTRSEIALPLIVGEQVLGALDVQSTQEAAFDDASAAVLQSMANQIAIALSNAQQFKQSAAALQQTNNLYQTGRQIAEATDQQAILQVLVTSAAPGADQAAFILFGPKDARGQWSYLESLATWALDEAGVPLTSGTRYPIERLPAVRYITPGTPYLVNQIDAPGIDADIQAFMQALNLKTMLTVPMSVGPTLLGVVVIGYRQPRTFTDDEIRTLLALSSQATVAVQNRLLLAETQAALQQLDTINRRLTGQAWRDYTRPAGGMVRLTDVGPGVSVTSTAQPDGGLTAPIVMRGETIGTLSLQDFNPNRAWSTNEIALVNAVANEVAIAVENARLIEQTERHAQREARLSQIAQRLRQATDIDSILQTASEELGRALETSHAQAQLGTPMPQTNHQHGNGQGGSNA